jgi:hypothetical protein
MCHFLVLVLACNLVGAALLGLGLLLSFPVSLLASASVFRTLKDAAPHEDQADAADERRLEAGGNTVVGRLIVSEGKVVRSSQPIPGVLGTHPSATRGHCRVTRS